MTTPLLHQLKDGEDVFDIEGTQYMSSVFSKGPNVTVSDIQHLIAGLPIIDISDGEYIHWIQLTPEALKYIQSISK